jgi:tetratricopeptide (TPR) repeat protein
VIALLVSLALAHPGYAKDIEKASRALKATPEDVSLLVTRADYARRDGAFADALADLDRAECLDPNLPDVWLHRGLTLFDMGRLTRAEAEITRYLETAPPSVHGLWTRGKIRRVRSNVDGAIADFDAALALGPDVDLHLERKAALVHARRFPQATHGLRQGLRDTGSAVLRYELGTLLLAQLDHTGVIEVCAPPLAGAGVKTRWWLLRARAHEGSGAPREAHADRLSALRESTSLASRRPSPLADRRLARVFLALGRYSDAIAPLKRAIDADANDLEAQALLRQARLNPP